MSLNVKCSLRGQNQSWWRTFILGHQSLQQSYTMMTILSVFPAPRPPRPCGPLLYQAGTHEVLDVNCAWSHSSSSAPPWICEAWAPHAVPSRRNMACSLWCQLETITWAVPRTTHPTTSLRLLWRDFSEQELAHLQSFISSTQSPLAGSAVFSVSTSWGTIPSQSLYTVSTHMLFPLIHL